MSKTDILEELPKLTLEERHEIRLKLAELDGDGWLDDDDPLTDDEKALLEARLMDAPANIWEELSMVKNLIHGYTQKLARYRCSHCCFKARQFYWQCPGCSNWETYPPRRTEELNVMN